MLFGWSLEMRQNRIFRVLPHPLHKDESKYSQYTFLDVSNRLKRLVNKATDNNNCAYFSLSPGSKLVVG